MLKNWFGCFIAFVLVVGILTVIAGSVLLTGERRQQIAQAANEGVTIVTEKINNDNNAEAGTETPMRKQEDEESTCYQDRGQPVEIPWNDFETFTSDTGAYGYIIPKEWIEEWTGRFNNLWFEGEWDTVDQHEVMMLDGSNDAQCIECALWVIPIVDEDECSGENFTQDDISSLFMGKKIYFTPEEVAATKTYIIHLEDGDELEIPYDNLNELPLSSSDSEAYFRAAIKLTCAVETPQEQFQFAERLPGAYNMAIGAEADCFWVAGVQGSWSVYDDQYHENFEVTNSDYPELEIYFIPETWSDEEMLDWAAEYFKVTPSEYTP